MYQQKRYQNIPYHITTHNPPITSLIIIIPLSSVSRSTRKPPDFPSSTIINFSLSFSSKKGLLPHTSSHILFQYARWRFSTSKNFLRWIFDLLFAIACRRRRRATANICILNKRTHIRTCTHFTLTAGIIIIWNSN